LGFCAGFGQERNRPKLEAASKGVHGPPKRCPKKRPGTCFSGFFDFVCDFSFFSNMKMVSLPSLFFLFLLPNVLFSPVIVGGVVGSGRVCRSDTRRNPPARPGLKIPQIFVKIQWMGFFTSSGVENEYQPRSTLPCFLSHPGSRPPLIKTQPVFPFFFPTARCFPRWRCPPRAWRGGPPPPT